MPDAWNATIPSEILIKICLIIAEDDEAAFRFPDASVNPHSITIVSKRWRAIALSTAQLFTHINLQIRRGYSRDANGIMTSPTTIWGIQGGVRMLPAKLSSLLALARKVPLYVTLDSPLEEETVASWKILIDYIRQIESLLIRDHPAERLFPWLLKDQTVSADHLVSLEIKIRGPLSAARKMADAISPIEGVSILSRTWIRPEAESMSLIAI